MDLEHRVERERAKIGHILGVSKWQTLDQGRIDAFADVTGDDQFIHIDQRAAANGPFGGTIAHGFLTLSLIAAMAAQTLEPLPGQRLFINYGFEKIRFLAPVPAGAQIRAQFKRVDICVRRPGQVLHTLEVQMEIKGHDKPALIATWLSLAVFS